MFLDRTDVLILKNLSENSRCKLKEMATKAGCSIQTISKRLRRLEEALRMRYTLELKLDELGYGNEFFIMATLKEDKVLDEPKLRLLSRFPQIQFAAITEGDFGLFLWCVTRDSREYKNDVEVPLRNYLDEYLEEWNAYPLVEKRVGFLPVGNDIIDIMKIPRKRKRAMKLLNMNSRLSVSTLARKLMVTEPTAEYHVKRVGGYVRRFTTFFEGRGEFIHIIRFLKLRGREGDFKKEGRELRELYLDSNPRLFDRLVYAVAHSGGMDNCFIENFSSLEDYLSHSNTIRGFSNIIKREMNARVKRIVKGSVPMRKIDVKKECGYLLHPAEL